MTREDIKSSLLVNIDTVTVEPQFNEVFSGLGKLVCYNKEHFILSFVMSRFSVPYILMLVTAKECFLLYQGLCYIRGSLNQDSTE